MRKPKEQYVLKYSCLVGDETPIINGKRPCCAACGAKQTTPVIEVAQHGFWEDAYTTVRRCAKCHQLTAYNYRIDLTLPEGEQTPLSQEK